MRKAAKLFDKTILWLWSWKFDFEITIAYGLFGPIPIAFIEHFHFRLYRDWEHHA